MSYFGCGTAFGTRNGQETPTSRNIWSAGTPSTGGTITQVKIHGIHPYGTGYTVRFGVWQGAGSGTDPDGASLVADSGEISLTTLGMSNTVYGWSNWVALSGTLTSGQKTWLTITGRSDAFTVGTKDAGDNLDLANGTHEATNATLDDATQALPSTFPTVTGSSITARYPMIVIEYTAGGSSIPAIARHYAMLRNAN